MKKTFWKEVLPNSKVELNSVTYKIGDEFVEVIDATVLCRYN